MEQNRYDAVIIGGGPAGFTAALYMARANIKVLILEKIGEGGLLSAHSIENYTGYFDGISGKDLYEEMKQHAVKFGAEVKAGTFLELLIDEHGNKVVKSDIGVFTADVVIIATGTSKGSIKKYKGEEEFLGKGVSYCATCDGAFFRNVPVAVVGNGYEAAEEALFLTRYASKVIIINKDLEFISQEELLEAVKTNPKIEIKNGYELLSIDGSDFVERVKIKKEKEEDVEAAGVFMYMGTKSSAELFSIFADIEDGYIITNEKMETLADGVYAAGDIRKKVLRQVVTAAADGAVAGVESIKYIMKKRKKHS